MAGAMFEGLRDILQPEADAPYAPGIPDTTIQLADAFIDVFLSYWGEIPWLDSEKRFSALLREHGPLNQHLLIESLLLRFDERCIVDHYIYHVVDLLTPALRALYSLGYDEFIIDLARLHEVSDKMPSCLYATEERPIRLRVHGDVDEAGYNLRHCIVDFYGDCRTAGEHAYRSVFRLHGRVEEEAGDMANESAFYLGEAGAVSTRGRNSLCSYHLAGPPTPEEKGRILASQSFWTMWNTLLVPDGNGSWTEVRP